MSLKDKRIWITGASSGIGAAFVKVASQQGAHLLISARSEDKLNAIAEANQGTGTIKVLPLDLTAMETHQDKVNAAIELMGSIDVMLHNGGISQRSLVKDTDLEVDRKVMEVDYFGTVSLTKALLPHFLEQGTGHFAVVTSLMGVFSSPMRSGYCGAKHALHGFFNSLRAEHHDDQIAVTLVCPGFIQTNISKNALVGDGSHQGTMDKATGSGLTAEQCAQRMAKAIAKAKPEVYIGRKEILAVYLKRFFPGILRKVVRKAAVT